MPAQKRPAPPRSPEDHQLLVAAVDAHDHDHHDGDNGGPPPPSSATAQQQRQLQQLQMEENEEEEQQHQQQPPPPLPPSPQQRAAQKDDEEMPPQEDDQKNDSNAIATAADDGGSPSSSSTFAADKDEEFVLVKLADIRKEVQCPICLGIIRKTRTVMECLHRFCRECIDKSMRLGNNECPACRTHCASRRSLRDDPNYDALISALYPDIDKYLEEELAFHEEDKTRNKKIQASIAETLRRQMEALGRRRSTAKATAAAFVRRSQGNYRSSRGQNSYQRGRNRSSSVAGFTGSDDDDEDANDNEEGKGPSSADEQSPDIGRPKRCRRWSAPRFSPASTAANVDGVCDEDDELEVGRESVIASPGRIGNREVLVWGKGGTRSQTQHGSSGGNGKNVRGSRITKFVVFLRNLDENEDEIDIQLTLLPLDEQSLPSLERLFLCCSRTLSVRHLCQFITQIAVQAEEVEILVKKSRPRISVLKTSTSVDDPTSQGSCDHTDEEGELRILEAQESLAGLHSNFSRSQGHLVLAYRAKS